MRAAEAAKLTLAMTDAPQNSTQDERATVGATSIEGPLAYQETIFRICLGYSRNYAEAEDLTQEVYLKAYQNIASLRDSSLAKEWLFRIAKNTCLDRQKKMRTGWIVLRRLAQQPDLPSDPAASEDFERRLGLLKSVIRHLPKKLRSVFVLREYGHLTYEELASTLHLNQGTVMSRLSRARRRVAAALQEKIHGQT
jgi:RNA polymerase sigma-70 factor (ECF subfamily)